MAKRRLFTDEISHLTDQGCRAEDWNKIWVAEDFSPGMSFQNVTFSGEIELGIFNSLASGPDGIPRPTGIFNSRLHNARIEDNCHINKTDIANTDVGHDTLLNRVGIISCTGETSYGNLVEANVLTEHGGRSVPLWRYLSSQVAHLLCHFRGMPAANAIKKIILKDVVGLKGSRSRIGPNCRIERCTELKNICVEEGAIIDGAASLNECYIVSERNAPAFIGEGVAAERCIFQKRSNTAGGVRMINCLVGEGTKLERGFSSEHSLFFANSAFCQGEAVSVLAGPFSVSHHKATLALAWQCSFNNFGSGANASNHHFKFGPLHGGILGRGARIGSGSYLLYPADIGAFSTVTGRNNNNLDTRDFPFSLIVGEGRRTVLVPGVNVFGTGSFRDERKWLDRDGRTNIEEPLDMYHSPLFSPYILQAMDKAITRLEAGVPSGDDIEVGGAIIPEPRFEPALKLYKAAFLFHTGLRLLEKVHHGKPEQEVRLKKIVSALSEAEEADGGNSGEWRDWGGLFVSGGAAARFITELEGDEYTDSDALRAAFKTLHDNFAAAEWRWLAWRWRKEYGQPDQKKARDFLGKWRECVLYRRSQLYRDAIKEFSVEKRISFGIEHDRDVDFHQARGHLESHPLFQAIEEENAVLLSMVDSIHGI